MTDFSYDMDADGVVTLTWDVKHKSMNVMSTEAFTALAAVLALALLVMPQMPTPTPGLAAETSR